MPGRIKHEPNPDNQPDPHVQCDALWSDAFNQTHVCDEPEGHKTPHLCHCGWETDQA